MGVQYHLIYHCTFKRERPLKKKICSIDFPAALYNC